MTDFGSQASKEAFIGVTNLLKLLEHHPSSDVAHRQNRVLPKCRFENNRFVGEAPQHDDVTLLIAKVL